MAPASANTNNPAAAQRAQTTEELRDNRQHTIANDPSSPGIMSIGHVVACNPQLCTAYVRMAGKAEVVPCTLGEYASNSYPATGVASTYFPPAGTGVLVFLPKGGLGWGVVLCVVPPMLLPTDGPNERVLVNTLTDYEPGAAVITESAWQHLPEDPECHGTGVGWRGRPLDQLPGEVSFSSVFGGHVLVGDLEQIFGASTGAQIQSFALEKLLRIVARQWQTWLPLQDTHAFDDHGYVTEECSGSHNKCERRGKLFFGDPWLTQIAMDKEKLENQELVPSPQDIIARRRHYRAEGFLAGQQAHWAMQPDPDTEVDTPGAQPIDRGNYAMQVDGSGRLAMLSGAGFFLERNDMIPVPRRGRDPQDPEGNKVEEDDPHKQKEPFKLEKDHPVRTSLWLEDYLAWEKKLWYQRFVELNKDFWVPEERDAKIPDDEYDAEGKARHDYEEYKGRRFVFWEGKDGSGGMRDHLGAEIVFAEGRVRINAPNGIELCSGTDVVVLAGHDLVAKAHDSVDIVAHTHDIRFAAHQHMQLLAQEGQLLLESLSTAQGQADVGERQGGGGVSILARESRVFLHGKSTQLSAVDLLGLETQEAERGLIVLSSNRVTATATTLLLADERGGSLSISRGQSILAGRSLALLAEQSMAQIENTRAWVPFWRLPLEFDFYAGYSESVDMLVDVYGREDEWQGNYRPEARDSIKFEFRNQDEYTLVGNSEFEFHDAYWQRLFRRENASEQVEEWESGVYDDTEIENRPWPGVDYHDSGDFLQVLESENNIERGRLLTLRESREREGGEFTAAPFVKLARLDSPGKSLLKSL